MRAVSPVFSYRSVKGVFALKIAFDGSSFPFPQPSRMIRQIGLFFIVVLLNGGCTAVSIVIQFLFRIGWKIKSVIPAKAGIYRFALKTVDPRLRGDDVFLFVFILNKNHLLSDTCCFTVRPLNTCSADTTIQFKVVSGTVILFCRHFFIKTVPFFTDFRRTVACPAFSGAVAVLANAGAFAERTWFKVMERFDI